MVELGWWGLPWQRDRWVRGGGGWNGMGMGDGGWGMGDGIRGRGRGRERGLREGVRERLGCGGGGGTCRRNIFRSGYVALMLVTC